MPMMPATTARATDRGHAARRITLTQRRVLLDRLRTELASVTEDIAATAEAIRSVQHNDVSRAAGQRRTDSERATLQLLEGEQLRQRLELGRLYREYESLALRAPRRQHLAAAVSQLTPPPPPPAAPSHPPDSQTAATAAAPLP